MKKLLGMLAGASQDDLDDLEGLLTDLIAPVQPSANFKRGLGQNLTQLATRQSVARRSAARAAAAGRPESAAPVEILQAGQPAPAPRQGRAWLPLALGLLAGALAVGLGALLLARRRQSWVRWRRQPGAAAA